MIQFGFYYYYFVYMCVHTYLPYKVGLLAQVDTVLKEAQEEESDRLQVCQELVAKEVGLLWTLHQLKNLGLSSISL